MLRTATLLASTGLLLAAACSEPVRHPADPGTPVDPIDLPADQKVERERLLKELEATKSLTLEEFKGRYPTNYASFTPADPTTVEFFDLIQASPVGLDSTERAALQQNGFVISDRQSFPSFLYGYQSIYMADLPVYVSADSILHAVHSSYDEILKTIEVQSLSRELDAMLTGMRQNLASGAASSLGTVAEQDVDFYLAVALSLLRGTVEAPVASGSAASIRTFFDAAVAASGWEARNLFGVDRNMDFSQFKPRGHYTDSVKLEQYFRAMMWLGRIDLRILETKPDHSQVFHRRQLEGAMAIVATMDQPVTDAWARVDTTIEAFVGESDNMRVTELKLLLDDLQVTTPAELTNKSDDEIARAIVAGSYGTQRISSHIMINGLGEGTMPLSSTFLVLGQRYVIDSHVFSNVVYDRVQHGNEYRMMPNPLDVAFAAIGNDHAADHLAAELAQFNYAPDLHAMRFLADNHGNDFWGANLYNRWLSALRELSPSAATANPAANGLPPIVATEAWGRRILNTQLASWAELRHDTILYAKQSYTGGASCEFPDAYVDPYPRFYDRLVNFAQHGRQIAMNLDLAAVPEMRAVVDYFDELETVSTLLQEMAEQQVTGQPYTEAQLAFINEAVVVNSGCGDPVDAQGWFARLYFDRAAGARFDPTIADVHTQPTDESGNPVGRVLHVGTGNPRLFVTTIETCVGPRAYVGLASSYFEEITAEFQRLDDEEWATSITSARPADVSWVAPIVAR